MPAAARDSDVPVIMLTARCDDLDIVGGLEAGADDYVVKPVGRGSSMPGSGPCCGGWPGPVERRKRTAT